MNDEFEYKVDPREEALADIAREDMAAVARQERFIFEQTCD